VSVNTEKHAGKDWRKRASQLPKKQPTNKQKNPDENK
jgi:hypothetical protein